MLFQNFFDSYYGVCWCFCFVVFFLSDLLLSGGLEGVCKGLVVGYFD